MKHIIQLFLAAVITSMVACTPEPLDIDIPQAPSKIVMSSQYLFDSNSNQSIFTVTLTRILSVTSDRAPIIDSNGVQIDSSLFINGATVTLQTPSGAIELTEVERGIYTTTSVLIEEGQHCMIQVKDANGNMLVQSKTTAMPTKGFEQVEVKNIHGQYHIEYLLADNPATSNWYVVNYFAREKKDSTGSYTDPRFIAQKLTEQKLEFELFSDADFINGKLSKSRKLPPTDFDTVAVAVTEITQGYYDFLTVQKRYGKLINQLRGEAMSFPTNVAGGLGYFNVTQPQVYVLDIEP